MNTEYYLKWSPRDSQFGEKWFWLFSHQPLHIQSACCMVVPQSHRDGIPVQNASKTLSTHRARPVKDQASGSCNVLCSNGPRQRFLEAMNCHAGRIWAIMEKLRHRTICPVASSAKSYSILFRIRSLERSYFQAGLLLAFGFLQHVSFGFVRHDWGNICKTLFHASWMTETRILLQLKLGCWKPNAKK